MVDNWSTQDGRIYDVLTIPCEAGGAISEGSSVKFGTAAADKIVVIVSAAQGDGFGIALKAASASGEVIPVLVIGVFKCTRATLGATIAAGDWIINSITTTVAKTAGSPTFRMGLALQQAATAGDNFLVLLGKTA